MCGLEFNQTQPVIDTSTIVGARAGRCCHEHCGPANSVVHELGYHTVIQTFEPDNRQIQDITCFAMLEYDRAHH